MAAWPTANQHEPRSTGLGFAGSASPACWSSSRRSPQPSATSCRRPRPRRRAPVIDVRFAASTVVRLARLTAPSPTARRSSTTRSRVSPTSIQLCSVPCARLRPTPRTTGSSSSSTAAGVPRSTRNNCSDEAISKYGSEAGSCPMGGHPRHVCSRVGGRGRHRALRCHGVAVRARRRVRAVPDLRQRTLALRTAPRSRRSRVPSHVRRPYAAIQGCSSEQHEQETAAAGRPCAWSP